MRKYDLILKRLPNVTNAVLKDILAQYATISELHRRSRANVAYMSFSNLKDAEAAFFSISCARPFGMEVAITDSCAVEHLIRRCTPLKRRRTRRRNARAPPTPAQRAPPPRNPAPPPPPRNPAPPPRNPAPPPHNPAPPPHNPAPPPHNPAPPPHNPAPPPRNPAPPPRNPAPMDM